MNILNWLSQDPLADRVYHVNKAMLLHMHDPLSGIAANDPVPRSLVTTDDYRRWMNISDRVFDLSDLFDDVALLMSGPGQVLDPEVDSDVSEDEP